MGRRCGQRLWSRFEDAGIHSPAGVLGAALDGGPYGPCDGVAGRACLLVSLTHCVRIVAVAPGKAVGNWNYLSDDR